MDVAEVTAILEIAQQVTLFGFMLVSLKYVDALRKNERDSASQFTDEIIEDWKRIKNSDNNK